jgi:hypothetical protein
MEMVEISEHKERLVMETAIYGTWYRNNMVPPAQLGTISTP